MLELCNTMVAQLINMLYNIVDRIYIGHMPGDGSLALTGVGVCMPIIMIVSAFASMISSGGAPKASIYMGKGDNESAEKVLGGCFTLQLIISAVLSIFLLIWNEDLLLLFGASENTMQNATITVTSTPAVITAVEVTIAAAIAAIKAL